MKTTNWLLSWMVSCTLLCLTTPAATLYVWQGSHGPALPYRDWATAAHTIQQAVDAASAGDTVLVTNGVYSSVTINQPITLTSVNGPAPTAVDGGRTNRCVWVGTNAVLSGLTLTNGRAVDGGGVWCESANALVTNCVLTGNSANYGGGVWAGTLNNCTLTSNAAYYYGGGAYWGAMDNCSLTGNWATDMGGGVYYGTLNNCTLTGNAAYYGGGAYWGTMNNCILTGNWATDEGGGAWAGTLNNCTLIGNAATFGGGAFVGTLNNCILAGNWATDEGGGAFSGTLDHCLLYNNEAAGGSNDYESRRNFCLTNDPAFVDYPNGNLRLRTNSPCMNAGTNAYVTTRTDLDGRPRIVGGRVDIGAYEFQGPFNAWLAGYGLGTDGSADFADPDGDGLNNWQECQADTNPINSASVLRLTILSRTPPLAVAFSSSAARLYTLESCTNLVPSPATCDWTNVLAQTKIPGSGGVLILTDANPPDPAFYRVSVEFP